VTASGAELGAHPVKAAEIASAAVSVALSRTETAKDLNTTEDKAASVGGLVSPICESTRREK
jgi:hypothetical protein